MRVISHGIDLVECKRIKELAGRHRQRFLDRVFTAVEQEYCRKNGKREIEHLAGRFAVKEAVMKILGTGWQNGIAWSDIETRNGVSGKPTVSLSGKVKEIADDLGIEEISISITHAGGLAIASAIAIGS